MREIITKSSTIGNGVNIDSNHVDFLQSSDASGISLVNVVFDGRGFQGWKRSILIALSAKNKLGFINGACLAPDLIFKKYQPWSRTNHMVTARLINSLYKDIGDSVSTYKQLKSSEKVWNIGLGSHVVPNYITLDLINEFDCTHLPTVASPLDANTKLKENDGPFLHNSTVYRHLVGKLN